MSTKHLVLFNNFKDHLATVTEDNRLKIWEIATNSLRQEYVEKENYTCIAWSSESPWNQIKSNKRDKSFDLGIIALGTENGTIVIWDLQKGEITQRLSKEPGGKGHNTTVHDIVFNDNGSLLYSCAGEKYAFEWDVKNGTVLRKFRGKDNEIYKLAISSNNNILAIASSSIKLYDLSSGSKLKSLKSGHTSNINQLNFAPNGHYLYSSSFGGRYINLYDCQRKDINEPILNFSLDGTPLKVVSIFEENQSNNQTNSLLGAVSDIGDLFLWKVELPCDICTKPIRPFCRITAKKNSIRTLTSLTTSFINTKSIFLAHGTTLKPFIEKVNLYNENMIQSNIEINVDACSSGFSAVTTKKNKTENEEEDTNQMNNKVPFLVPIEERGMSKSLTMKNNIETKNKNSIQSVESNDKLTLAERIAALQENIDNEMNKEYEKSEIDRKKIQQDVKDFLQENVQYNKGKLNVSSLSTLLSQAIHSDDTILLAKCMEICDEKIINATVERISADKVLILLRKIVSKMLINPNRVQTLCIWVHSILLNHTAYLMTVPDLSKNLSALYQVLENRVQVYQKATKLAGRLHLVLNQISKSPPNPVKDNEKEENVPVYNEDELESDESDMEPEKEEKLIANGSLHNYQNHQ